MTCYISKSTGARYDDEFHSQGQIPEDAIEITRDKLLEISNGVNNGKVLAWAGDLPILKDAPPPSHSELMTALKSYRDISLHETDKYVRRHQEEKEQALKTTLPEATYKALLAWRQKLRDLPDTVKPEALADPRKAIPACPVAL